MFATVKPIVFWLAETAIGGSLAAAAAPLVLVSKQVLSGLDRREVRRPTLKVVDVHAAGASPPAPIRIAAAPAPPGQHWQRLTKLIAADVAAARTAVDLQAAARVQLDAADFTLSQIMQDLVQVMPGLGIAETARPAAIAGRRLAA
jgi:hypothetical protein